MTPAPLLRVLDLTDGLAANAVRLLVGLGADVIRVRADTAAPPTPQEAVHWYAGTRTLTVPEGELDRVVGGLVVDADVVIESGAVDELRTLDLRPTDPQGWAGAAHVVVTPFGLTGPRSGWRTDDGVAAASGGMTWLGGRPGEAPVPPPQGQATQLAGTHAAVAALLAVVARRRTGRGQLAEVSVQEAVAATLETGAIAWIHAGTVPGRTGGVYGHVAHRVFPTADGFVAGGYSGPDRMWKDLLAWMDETGEAADLTGDVWRDPVHRWRHRVHVDEVVTAWTRRRTTGEIAVDARRRALPWAEVAGPTDLVTNPQLRARDFFLQVSTPQGTLLDTGFPHESPGRPRPVRLAAPTPVGTGARWHAADAPAALPSRMRHAHGGALAGLRVLDLTWVLAGPYVTRILGDHGADIVKVESAHRQDPTRFAPSMRLRADAGPEESGYFINFNRGKRSLALNLRSAQGPHLLRRLAAEVDVVVENFSPGTLAKWGLDFEQLRRINPDAVLVSMSGVGATGPWRSAVTFADTLAAWSGLTHATGGDDGIPQGLTFGLGDMVAANAAVVAVLDRVLRGGGGHVDLSQLEAMAAHLGTAVLDTTVPAADDDRVGPFVLRAPGDDRWLSVGRVNPERLAEAVEGTDPVRGLEEYAAATDPDRAAAHLQGYGIPAYPVRDGRDLVEGDPQLRARGFYPTLGHPLVGEVRVEGVLHHLTDTPPRLDRPAPLLGEHTEELLGEMLGLTTQEITDLRERGVLV
ncbi:CoA transferase [Micromonospora sp. SH-82]|uniref:CaiB/BaiF CoA-transferase family protein n=1 Tax=Micromonospora sp. SH-82 TaxID=3132938 RepID=UPI003EB995C7